MFPERMKAQKDNGSFSGNEQKRQKVTQGGMHEGHTNGPHRGAGV
jgi:hypothetical protein